MSLGFPSDDSGNLQWYCLKTRVRSENQARRTLSADMGLEVFCPVLRFERPRKAGKVRVTEAMFPGYIFARFDYPVLHRRVAATNGVSKILSFGGHPAIVDVAIISELRSVLSDNEVLEIPRVIDAGTSVHVVAGPFSGLRTVVTRVLPARARVAVLMELLGMPREIELCESDVLPELRHPLAAT